MHELSICASIVESVSGSMAAYPGSRVLEVRLRIGALASVVEDSLKFCWQIATEDTPLASSKLVIHPVPVTINCKACSRSGEIGSLQHFRCRWCGAPATDIRTGRELEIESVEIEDAPMEVSS